jgi:hypothetical protein
MILGFITQKQILDNWCWAAVASSISFYYNSDSQWLQSTIAANLIDSSCALIDTNNATAAPTICDVSMDLATVLNATQNLYGTPLERQLSFNEIVDQINANAPVCCQIVWQAISAAHYLTIYGYDGADIIIGDPEAGIFSINYNDFCSGYRGGSWSRSFGTQTVQAI